MEDERIAEREASEVKFKAVAEAAKEYADALEGEKFNGLRILSAKAWPRKALQAAGYGEVE